MLKHAGLLFRCAKNQPFTEGVMCRKGFSLLPFRCSNCSYRTPYDKASGIWHPYLYRGTKYGTWFVAKCKQCGKKPKLKGLVWLLVGGVILGISANSLALSLPLLVPVGIIFIITLTFFTIKWMPYEK